MMILLNPAVVASVSDAIPIATFPDRDPHPIACASPRNDGGENYAQAARRSRRRSATSA